MPALPAPRLLASSGASSRRRGRWCSPTMAGPRAPGGPAAPGPITTRRRLLALGEAAVELTVACWFEAAFRPAAPGDDTMGLRGTAASLLPFQYPPEVKAAAEAELALGREMYAAGEYSEAIEKYARVLEIAPRQYKACQAARSATADAWEKLGDRDKMGEARREQWLWGRGVRWPGHYILAYILARRAFVPPASPPAGAEARKPLPGENFSMGLGEGLLIAALAGAYNYVLYYYGLEI